MFPVLAASEKGSAIKYAVAGADSFSYDGDKFAKDGGGVIVNCVLWQP